MKILAAALVVLSWGACLEAGDAAAGKKPTPILDGVWWDETGERERTGFLDGASDCLTWTARLKGYNAPSARLAPELDRFYQTHPKQKKLPLLAAWRRVVPEMAAKQEAETPRGPGEEWSNAHWYLNGGWWAGRSTQGQLGFVEGHLWCARTYVKAPTPPPQPGQNQPSLGTPPVYSHPAAYYVQKIDEYYAKHGYNEAIADVLARYQDKGKPAGSFVKR
jgi:hypothetical protein